MPGFSNFFALNQNNSTTTTYSPEEVYSYYFKPFYFKRGVNGVGEEPTIFTFSPGEHHYIELSYVLHFVSPSAPPNGFLFKTTLGFNDGGTLISRASTEYLSSPFTSQVVTNLPEGIENNIKVTSTTIKAFLPNDNVTIQGMYQYI